MHRYVDFTPTNGRLLITLTSEGREAIASAIAEGQNIDSDQLMHDLFEWQTCNGWEWIAPEDIGALTSSPILGDCAERDDRGVLKRIQTVYWFPNYQVESIVRTLHTRGSVTFTGVTS